MEKVHKDVLSWFKKRGFKPLPFQLETWSAILSGKSGIINAPTGSGKTLAFWMGIMQKLLLEKRKSAKGLKVLYISPLRSLSKDIHLTLQQVADDLKTGWRVELRTGDTSSKDRERQKRAMPDCLITTPESLHILLAQKQSSLLFTNLELVVVDEWHDLLGSKRGTQVELGLSRLKGICPKLSIWGVSATIANLQQALEVLVGKASLDNSIIIRADIQKEIELVTLFPETIERFPWGGRVGLPMLQKVLEVIYPSESALVFTNTRAQTEIWYQNLLLFGEELAGNMAIHHSSLDMEIRLWVEEALKNSKLKVVVCTSSLDLGVDFAPVEAILQIGSPKDVSRILQRAGRSGHKPGQKSKVFFVPTHSMELIDAAALQTAIQEKKIEGKSPYMKPIDVLVQYLVTLAVGEGFNEAIIQKEVLGTYAYSNLTQMEWNWVMNFITTGGETLGAYNEFVKVVHENGLFKVTNRRIAMRHRLSIGTIVGNTALKVKMLGGAFLGTVEEAFFSKMKQGDVFWFGGRPLEMVMIKEMTVLVRKATKGKGAIPAWGGGRMPLSSTFAFLLRQKVDEVARGNFNSEELLQLKPLIDLQAKWSLVPKSDQFLIEYFKSREGFHLVFYPFEGRAIHEIMASLVAFRISRVVAISFSMGMNDYGFELLSDQEIDVEEILSYSLFSIQNLENDLENSVNEAEMARRKFRDIAAISGLVFQGFPGKALQTRHLQSSSQLIYDVFEKYEPDNLLFRQAHLEVLDFQMENSRLVETLQRINAQKIELRRPSSITPFSFPILVDMLREKLTSESLEARISKMTIQLEKKAAVSKNGD